MTIMGLMQLASRPAGTSLDPVPVTTAAGELTVPLTRSGARLTHQRLLDHEGRRAGSLIAPHDDAMAAHVYAESLKAQGVRAQAERCWIFMSIRPVDLSIWNETTWQALVQEHTVLMLKRATLEQMTDDRSTRLQACQPAIHQGASIGLVWCHEASIPSWPDTLPVSHVILSLDTHPLEVVEQRLNQLRQCYPLLQVMVTDVTSDTQRQRIMSLGAMLCAGPTVEQAVATVTSSSAH